MRCPSHSPCRPLISSEGSQFEYGSGHYHPEQGLLQFLSVSQDKRRGNISIAFFHILSDSSFHNIPSFDKSRDSSVGIALGYGLDDRGSRIRFPAGDENFSLHHRVQNGSGAHPVSYPMSTGDPFPEGKVAGA
jgi:hypothetical protein